MNRLLFCFLSLITTTLFSAESKNHIVILLDTSGSMEEPMSMFNQSKMDAAKIALISVVDKIPDDTVVGLLGFESWIYPLGEMNKLTLSKSIQDAKITPQSGTPIGTYLKKAADALLLEREKQFGYGTYKIIIVTDGLPTNEPDGLVERYVPDITYRGIKIDCIGVNMPRNYILKTKVHNYMSADDPNSLQKEVEKTVLAEISLDDNIQSDFEDIALISNEMSMAIIENLDSNKNHPIGESPEVIEESSDSFLNDQVGPTNINTVNTPTASKDFGMVLFIVVVVVIVGFFILIAAANS